jgi:hypothetical protein
MDQRRLCASPTCFCETAYLTCSLWCASLEIPAGVRCLCRHEECLRHSTRGSATSGGDAGQQSNPLVLARVRRAVA